MQLSHYIKLSVYILICISLVIYTYIKTGFKDYEYLYNNEPQSEDVLVYEKFHNGMCDSAYYNGFSHTQSNGYDVKYVPYTSTQEVIRLTTNHSNANISKPTDVPSITQKYVFNYNSNVDESTGVLYSMLNSGWEIDTLESNSKMISARLLRDGVQARMFILPNTLKLYCKTDLNKEVTE